jgi:hypothetical protein
MFRKSVFIMLFVCLLTMSSVVMAYPWEGQLEWNGSAGDANWYNSANWNNQGTPVCPTDGTGPSWNNYCAVLPNQPGPRITGNATTSMLSLNPWDPTSWGGQDCNVIIAATALDVNCGTAIQINSQVDYDSYLGTATLVNKAILNVYGGTVTTPRPDGGGFYGVTVGGGTSNYGMAYGMLNIYGGEVNVPRVRLFYGEIGLYGGTLRINTEPNLIISTDHPEATLNKVKINGGTLVLLGDQTAALAVPIGNGQIVCERGTLGTPTFADGWTTLVSDINYCVWNPQPANGATNVHYYNPDGNSITLSWRPTTFEDLDVNHDVYFGPSFEDVNKALKADANYCYMGSLKDPCDPCSYVVKDPNKFVMNTTYYWRVDEYSNSGSNFKKGLVWSFTTHNGKAYNPKPVNGGTILSQPLQLSWTSGDFSDAHRVFFGTSSTTVTNASTSSSDGRYRGTVTSPVYPLTRLLETAAPAYVAWTIQAGTTYYWRIDEVNNFLATPVGGKGTVWSFTPGGYVNIDDFEDSMSTEDVNANWPDLYPVTGCTAQIAHSGRILVRDSTGKFLQYTFNNSGKNPAFTLPYTEAKRPYPGGTSFTGGGVVFPAAKLLRIDYRGTATNPVPGEGANPLTDNMYVAIEDTVGNVSVYLNPDANAQLVGNWTSWYTQLTDINAVGNTNLNAITGFAIGFGIRCNNYDYDGRGDTDPNGVVFFDNIRLYGSTCVPGKGPAADMDGDCDVDINDMDRLASDWLQHADNFVFSPCTVPSKAPILWYKFNESGPTTNTVIDYGTGDGNDYTGTVNAFIAANWKSGGGRDGNNCLYLPPGGGCYVLAPVAAPLNSLSFMGDTAHRAPADGNSSPGGGGISFSVWINADMTAGNMQSSWNGLFGTWNGAVSTETLEIHCPSPFRQYNAFGPATNFIKRTPAFTVSSGQRPESDFGGRWNHWAFVKSPSSMALYLNGNLLRQSDANQQTGDPNVNVYGPLFDPNVGSFRIGTRGGNWGMWNGYIQDFQVYDYNLTPAEVAYLATDGEGEVFLPLVSPANINKDGAATPELDVNQIVDFRDMAIMCNEWHTIKLWP